jgi:hypothetical protein
MEYKFSDDFEEEDYVEILLKGYDYNQLGLDIIIFVLNVLLFIFNPILSAICLVLYLVTFYLSMVGHDKSLGKNYKLGNKLFDISDFLNNIVYILTIINLILGAI